MEIQSSHDISLPLNTMPPPSSTWSLVAARIGIAVGLGMIGIGVVGFFASSGPLPQLLTKLQILGILTQGGSIGVMAGGGMVFSLSLFKLVSQVKSTPPRIPQTPPDQETLKESETPSPEIPSEEGDVLKNITSSPAEEPKTEEPLTPLQKLQQKRNKAHLYDPENQELNTHRTKFIEFLREDITALTREHPHLQEKEVLDYFFSQLRLFNETYKTQLEELKIAWIDETDHCAFLQRLPCQRKDPKLWSLEDFIRSRLAAFKYVGSNSSLGMHKTKFIKTLQSDIQNFVDNTNPSTLDGILDYFYSELQLFNDKFNAKIKLGVITSIDKRAEDTWVKELLINHQKMVVSSNLETALQNFKIDTPVEELFKTLFTAIEAYNNGNQKYLKTVSLPGITLDQAQIRSISIQLKKHIEHFKSATYQKCIDSYKEAFSPQEMITSAIENLKSSTLTSIDRYVEALKKELIQPLGITPQSTLFNDGLQSLEALKQKIQDIDAVLVISKLYDALLDLKLVPKTLDHAKNTFEKLAAELPENWDENNEFLLIFRQEFIQLYASLAPSDSQSGMQLSEDVILEGEVLTKWDQLQEANRQLAAKLGVAPITIVVDTNTVENEEASEILAQLLQDQLNAEAFQN